MPLKTQLKSLERSKAVCFGKEVSLADVCLIPQVYNANRFNFAMDDYPLISEINAYCSIVSCFSKGSS